jgi:hypothetical protein
MSLHPEHVVIEQCPTHCQGSCSDPIFKSAEFECDRSSLDVTNKNHLDVLSKSSDTGTVCPETIQWRNSMSTDRHCHITYPSQNTGKLTKGGQPKVRHFYKDWYSK